MAQLYAGTSGWAYPSWKPEFYPAKLPQKNFLQYYATQLNAVEVNFTFRQLVKETTAQKWIAETPAGFRFSVKAHQVITHIKRLKKGSPWWIEFRNTAAKAATCSPISNTRRLHKGRCMRQIFSKLWEQPKQKLHAENYGAPVSKRIGLLPMLTAPLIVAMLPARSRERLNCVGAWNNGVAE